jgi:hypothetical protein
MCGTQQKIISRPKTKQTFFFLKDLEGKKMKITQLIEAFSALMDSDINK